MYENIYLNLVKYQDLEEVAKLKKLLGKIGVEMKIEEGTYGTSVIIEYDTIELRKKTTRNAGRRRKNTEYLCTYGEMEKLVQKNGLEKTLESLGISRATYFRRKKDIEEAKELDIDISDDYI